MSDGESRDYRWWEDPEKFEKLEQALAIGSTLQMAWSYAEITYTQYYYYLNNINPGYKERVEMLEQKLPLKAANILYKGIEDNPELALKVLERIVKKKFAPRTELTGEEGGAITGSMDAQSLDERINAVLEKLKGINEQSPAIGSASDGVGTPDGTA